MPLFILIILVFGISCALYGLISKIIEVTSEKTVNKLIQKLHLGKQ